MTNRSAFLVVAFACLLSGGVRAADLPRAGMRCEHHVGVAMHRIAAHVESDPQGLWSDAEIWNPNTPDKTDIWSGDALLCDGSRLVVTQIVNRQCSSATECPARVVRRGAKGGMIALGYKQICMNHSRIAVSGDGAWLTACDVDYRLAR